MARSEQICDAVLRTVWTDKTKRCETDKTAKVKYDHEKENDMPIVQRIKEMSEKYKVTMAQISIAWLLSKKNVASPIVGVTKIAHLMDAIKAVNVKLTEEEIKYLEEPYQPHNVVGALKREQQK